MGAIWPVGRILAQCGANNGPFIAITQMNCSSLPATVQRLTKQAKKVAIIFNNNSGGDAADNALALQQILGVTFENLAPKGPEQTSLF